MSQDPQEFRRQLEELVVARQEAVVEGEVVGLVGRVEGEVKIKIEDPKVEEETLDRLTNNMKTLSLRESESYFGENSSFRILEVRLHLHLH